MPSFEIFSAARLRDFPVLRAAVRRSLALLNPDRIVVAVPTGDVKAVQGGLGSDVMVIDENSLLSNFDRPVFQRRPIPYFPQSFGWYLQQILKFEYCRQTEAAHCLVWDADTVPLQSIEFFDGEGRIYLTSAAEYHEPYFYTFERLIGRAAPSANSFISQHMLVRCASMRSLCRKIEQHHAKSWTDALGDILEKHPARRNLFSEYETYANYMLMYEPESVRVRELKWARCENAQAWALSEKALRDACRGGGDFAAYESKDAAWSRIFLKSLEKAPSALKRIAVSVALRRAAAGACRASD
jgi:hypothetical protein